jgi:hypothetical protein
MKRIEEGEGAEIFGGKSFLSQELNGFFYTLKTYFRLPTKNDANFLNSSSKPK